jgi:hypothetical protein
MASESMASVQAAEKSTSAANPGAHWPIELQQESEDNRFNPIVGSVLCLRSTSSASGT